MMRRGMLAVGLALGANLVFGVPVPTPNDDWPAIGPGAPRLQVGEILPPKDHPPRFPPKDARTLFSDVEIQQTRDNIAKYPAARAVLDGIRKKADYWVGWSDESLRALIPTAEVPRSFECCPEGCPVHGRKIFEVTGSFYPWVIDPKKPFQVTCPIGGESYPSNDYGKFYRSGFKDRSDFNGPYVDDGRGWVGPNGQRYWFVACWNHWLWVEHPVNPHDNLQFGLLALGRAYLLTGDRRYAHKAAVLLARIAEVYPNMDHESQSRYGQLMAEKDGTRYTGKVINAIWESYLLAVLGETYDAVWETMPADTALQQQYGRSAAALRALIEGNILEEGIDAIYEKKARGNYGTHQRALVILAIVRQHGDTARYLHTVLDKPDGTVYLGLRTALNSFIFRDGQPFESPGYNELWLQNLTALAELLPKLGVNIETLPRLRRVYDAPLASIAIGRHTPAIGDTLGVYGGIMGADPAVYGHAYRVYHDARYAQFLAAMGAIGEGGFKDFNSLLHPPIAAVAPLADGRRVAPQPSRLLSGYGLGFLNNAADDVGVSFYFGQHVNHAHYDRMQFDLFAHGQPMTPDLGYPDAMNEYVPGIFTWSLHTVSHNTVMVDATQQPGNAPGIVELMAEGAGARVLDVSAAGTYPQCETYRRALVLVDTGPHQSYLVDFFDVAGGREHDYGLHGPPGTFVLTGGKWTPPAKGTLAGENVGLDEIYDDPVLGAKDYAGGYMGYKGSGFQHFNHVQRLESGTWAADYTHEKDPQARLRIRVLDQPGQTVMLADARVTPVKFPQVLKYVLARRVAAPGEKLQSAFVSVLEPHTGTPPLVAVSRVNPGSGSAVVATRADGRTDVIVHDLTSAPKSLTVQGHTLSCPVQAMVATFDAAGKLERLFFAGGPKVEIDGQTYSAPARAAGRVMRVDPAKSEVVVHLDEDHFVAASDGPTLAGRVVRFSSPAGATAHTVAAAQATPEGLVLTTQDDLIVGQLRVGSVDNQTVVTPTRLVFAPSYNGTTALDMDYRPIGVVEKADQDRIELAGRPAAGVAQPGSDVLLSSVGPGDRMEAPYVFAWQR